MRIYTGKQSTEVTGPHANPRIPLVMNLIKTRELDISKHIIQTTKINANQDRQKSFAHPRDRIPT